jgi:hypothetical protein
LTDEEEQLLETRISELEQILRPENALQRMYVHDAALASIKIEKAEIEERTWLQNRVDRAAACWAADRQAEVGELAAKLAKKPHAIAPKLRQSLYGCMWLKDQWHSLAGLVAGGAAGSGPCPLDEQGRACAFDLLGLTEIQRLGRTVLDPPGALPRDVAATAAHQAAVIAEQIAALDKRTDEQAIALDESNRFETEAGNPPAIDSMTRLYRRYHKENVALRDRALAALKRAQNEGIPFDIKDEIRRQMDARTASIQRPSHEGPPTPAGSTWLDFGGETPPEPAPQPVSAPQPEPEDTAASSATQPEAPAAPTAKSPSEPFSGATVNTPRPGLAARFAAGEPLSRRQRKELERRTAAHRTLK